MIMVTGGAGFIGSNLHAALADRGGESVIVDRLGSRDKSRQLAKHPPFANVFGPNEYHKGPMISVVKIKHDEIAADGPAALFRSDQPGIGDGEQRRDFVWVGDAIDVMLWLLDTPRANGLFNVGTGEARS